MRNGPLLAIGLALVSACGHDFEPPDQSERVRAAEAAYAVALFDSIEWADTDQRLDAGNAVYGEECRRCHGPIGLGDTDYARERGLSVPSLVDRDWPLAQVDSTRRKVYVGHESSMPIFGDGSLSLREIDAVSGYILSTLRPEVLDGG